MTIQASLKFAYKILMGEIENDRATNRLILSKNYFTLVGGEDE